MKSLLKELVETPGVSGQEHEIRDKIREEVKDHADSVEVDDMGNLIARKGEGDKTLMVATHMDQIGLAVKRVDENGFLKVTKVGGLYPESLINQRVTVHTSEGEDVTGVVGMKPPHLRRSVDENDKIPEFKEIYVDIGAEDDEDAEDIGVRIGDRMTFDRDFADLQNDNVTAPAFDNRTGCAVLIEAIKEFDEDYELAAVFSTQEEVGTKGARTSAFGIDPDVALAVDVTMAGDVPGIEPDQSDEALGDGVGIDMLQASGRGLIPSENVTDWLLETAEEGDHDYYRGLYDGGATDAAGIYISRDGIPTGSLGIPTRNLHSPIEIVNVKDLKKMKNFLSDAFGSMPEYF
ncbi:MAG: M42 family metallopeptidase [Candidatus Nanohalobium sp.]